MRLPSSHTHIITDFYITRTIFFLTLRAKTDTVDSDIFSSYAICVFDLCFARRLKYANSSSEKLHNSRNILSSGIVKSYIGGIFFSSFNCIHMSFSFCICPGTSLFSQMSGSYFLFSFFRTGFTFIRFVNLF